MKCLLKRDKLLALGSVLLISSFTLSGCAGAPEHSPGGSQLSSSSASEEAASEETASEETASEGAVSEGAASGTLDSGTLDSGELQSGVSGGVAAAGSNDSPNIASSFQSSYPSSLESDSGLFVYYNQTDDRWAHALFGPRDPILTHGCGPTVLAMLISSYSSTSLNPREAADWAAQNGYCIPGEGSAHTIIEGGCAAFGLSAVPLSAPTPDAILKALSDGKVVVALMGPGYFTDSGHFVVIIKALEDQTVRIADPANLEHCGANWPLPFLISQLKKSACGGGPLWAVGYPDT